MDAEEELGDGEGGYAAEIAAPAVGATARQTRKQKAFAAIYKLHMTMPVL
jgi:hypothetical protein